MTMAKLRNDDTAAGAITQGGHGTRRGNSLWWIIPTAALLAALAIGWILSLEAHRGDDTPHGKPPPIIHSTTAT